MPTPIPFLTIALTASGVPQRIATLVLSPRCQNRLRIFSVVLALPFPPVATKGALLRSDKVSSAFLTSGMTRSREHDERLFAKRLGGKIGIAKTLIEQRDLYL